MKKSKMNFTSAIFICYSKYFYFKGRAKRAEFWWFNLFFILFVVLAFLGAFTQIIILLVLGIVVVLLFTIPFIAVSVRRFHDINKSGWWYLVNFVPFVGSLIFMVMLIEKGTLGKK